jgi:glycine cleavage system aminomethyltransferase T
MGYVEADYAKSNRDVQVRIRDKPVTGRIVDLPFVPHRYAT